MAPEPLMFHCTVKYSIYSVALLTKHNPWQMQLCKANHSPFCVTHKEIFATEDKSISVSFVQNALYNRNVPEIINSLCTAVRSINRIKT